jgi:hypothetical protein
VNGAVDGAATSESMQELHILIKHVLIDYF